MEKEKKKTTPTNAPIKFQFPMGIALIRSQMDENVICVAKAKAVVSLCFHDRDSIHLLCSNGWDIELRFPVYYIIAQLHESASNENICQLPPNNRPIWNSSSWNPICDGSRCAVWALRKSRQRDPIYFIWCEQFRTSENNNRKENNVACS